MSITRYRVPPPPRGAIRQEPEHVCDPGTQELRRMETDGGSVQYRLQCTVCGASGNAIAHNRLNVTERENAPPYNRSLREQFYREMAERRHQQRSAGTTWTEWYAQYLQSYIWKDKRDLVFNRAARVCEACGVARATNVHHLTYDHVGAEPLFDLAAVCQSCHDEIHGRETAT